MRRVVVTGLGIVSPLGLGIDHNWQRLVNGETGIGRTQQCDVSDISCQVSGEVPRTDAENALDQGQLNYDEWLSPKERRKTGDFITLGMIAADMALEDAGWHPTDIEDQYRTGVLVGSGIGGLQGIYDTSVTLYEKGPRRVSPFFIPSCLINLVSGNISIKHGLKGPNHAVVTACATGAHAIGDAARLIQYGDADVMVAGGAEATVCRIALSGFASMRAMSTNFNDRPAEASRPWDQDHDGFVMGEGAGVLILEELEHAKKRGAKIYAEFAGYGLSGDAFHISAPDEEGGYRAMKMSLDHAKVSPEDLDYINAHGTSTPAGDGNEINMVRRLCGASISDLAMSSTKSAIGHLLGAAGAVEAIYSILAMKHQVVPPTLNLHNPVPEAEGVNLVPLVAQERKIETILSNSFGFGGTNASLVFKKFSK